MMTDSTEELAEDVIRWLLRNHSNELSPKGRDYTDWDIAQVISWAYFPDNETDDFLPEDDDD